jgi:hypothetical protein
VRPDLCLAAPELPDSTRLKHGLEVVHVADHLPRSDRQARWLTERQLRHAQVRGQCESHWYAVPTVAQERILQAAAVLDVCDLATIWNWPPATVRRE